MFVVIEVKNKCLSLYFGIGCTSESTVTTVRNVFFYYDFGVKRTLLHTAETRLLKGNVEI